MQRNSSLNRRLPSQVIARQSCADSMLLQRSTESPSVTLMEERCGTQVAAAAAPPAAVDATAAAAPLSPGAQQHSSVQRRSAAAPAATDSGEDPALKPAGNPAAPPQSPLPGTNATGPSDTGSDGFRPLMRDGSCKVHLSFPPPVVAACEVPQAAAVLPATNAVRMPGNTARDSTEVRWVAGRRHTLLGGYPAVIGGRPDCCSSRRRSS